MLEDVPTTDRLDAVVEVLFTHYEDEDAHLLVYVPQGTDDVAMERLRAVLSQRSIQLLEAFGLLILVGVYDAAAGRQLMGKPAREF